MSWWQRFKTGDFSKIGFTSFDPKSSYYGWSKLILSCKPFFAIAAVVSMYGVLHIVVKMQPQDYNSGLMRRIVEGVETGWYRMLDLEVVQEGKKGQGCFGVMFDK